MKGGRVVAYFVFEGALCLAVDDPTTEANLQGSAGSVGGDVARWIVAQCGL